ncbi:MAG: hypothetical protein PHP57_04480 [Sideroxydans sp.]|nr:hypothetical protein [Sideroxydans sp.]
MHKYVLFIFLLIAPSVAMSDTHQPNLQVEVNRVGSVYSLAARFDSSLTQCAAYRYLTDYEAAKGLPGVVESNAVRISPDTVMVERVADERVLFMRIRLRSKMEYKEQPKKGISFTQMSGDSKRFEGNWHIDARPHGSTLLFEGTWEPDTVIPLFVIDHFAKNGLIDRFGSIAQLAEKNKSVLSDHCDN